MQPTGQCSRPTERTRLPGQYEKGGLKAVFGAGRVREHAPTDTQHHRPIPSDQRGKCHLVTSLDKSVQQRGVQNRLRRGHQPADVFNQLFEAGSHGSCFSWAMVMSLT